MPPKSYRFGEWNSERYKRWARSVGPCTYELIDRLFSVPPEQKYYTRAHAILNLEKTYTKERLEIACGLAMKKYRYTPSSKQIRSILEYGEDLRELSERKIQTGRKNEKAYTRGAEYYAGNNVNGNNKL